MVSHACHPAYRRLRQGDSEFKASLGHTASPFQTQKASVFIKLKWDWSWNIINHRGEHSETITLKFSF